MVLAQVGVVSDYDLLSLDAVSGKMQVWSDQDEGPDVKCSITKEGLSFGHWSPSSPETHAWCLRLCSYTHLLFVSRKLAFSQGPTQIGTRSMKCRSWFSKMLAECEQSSSMEQTIAFACHQKENPVVSLVAVSCGEVKFPTFMHQPCQ